MKKIIYLIIVLVVIGGCGKKYSNEEVIADLDKITNKINQMKVSVEETDNIQDLDNNLDYKNISTTVGSVYFRFYGKYKNYRTNFLSNDYWKPVFGEYINLNGIDGVCSFLYVKNNTGMYFLDFLTLDYQQDYFGITFLDEGEYIINGDKISYLCAKYIEGDLIVYKHRPISHRIILYQVNINLSKMDVNLKMLAYKTWNDGKLIEEKYFY